MGIEDSDLAKIAIKILTHIGHLYIQEVTSVARLR